MQKSKKIRTRIAGRHCGVFFLFIYLILNFLIKTIVSCVISSLFRYGQVAPTPASESRTKAKGKMYFNNVPFISICMAVRHVCVLSYLTFNPLTPRSDSHVTFTYDIRPLSSKLVVRVLKYIR